MTEKRDDRFAAIDLAGSEYTVEQTGRDENFRPEYEVRDVTGDVLFQSTYRMYQDDAAFPVVDAEGEEVCTVTATGTWDIAGEYLLTDSPSGQDLVVLDDDLSITRDAWRIRDAEGGSLLAEIESRGALVTAARTVLPFGQWIAHEYEITDPAGDHVGSIKSEFAMFDRYEITIDQPGSIPTGAIVIGTIVVDAIQKN